MDINVLLIAIAVLTLIGTAAMAVAIIHKTNSQKDSSAEEDGKEEGLGGLG